MRKYEAIESGIVNKDIEALRESVGSICYTDRDFSGGEFDEAVKYVESKGIKLREDALSGPPTISSQKTSFTDDDFADAVFELKENFCDARINDVKTIGRALYGTDTNQSDQAESDQSDGQVKKMAKPADKRSADPNARSRARRKVIGAVVCVAAVILLIIVLVIRRR